MRTLLAFAVLLACFFIFDYCHQERWQPAPFITADSLLLGRNRISMIVGSRNSLCDLRNDRGTHFSALFWSPPGQAVRVGGCDGLHKEWLSEWPQRDPRSLMSSAAAVAPSNLYSYWPVLKTGKNTLWCTVQRAVGCSSYVFFSEKKWVTASWSDYKTHTFVWGSLIWLISRPK